MERRRQEPNGAAEAAPAPLRPPADGRIVPFRQPGAARAGAPFPLGLARLALLFLAVTAIARWVSAPPEVTPLSVYLTVVWSAYLPIAVVGTIGAGVSRRRRLARFDGVVGNRVVVVVPTLGRPDVEPALARVVRSLLAHAPRHLRDFRVDLVMDEGAPLIAEFRRRYRRDRRVRVVVVPAAYRTPAGTRFKARANQYALDERAARGECDDGTWVYHLDDDTAVGADTIAAVAGFIARDDGRVHLVQGVLAFPLDLSPSWFCRLADSVRPADDLTRFRFFTDVLGRPLVGLHGEHLLVRASVEAEIGWDFGPRVTVEDAYFALWFARRYPGRAAFLEAYTYGASPASVRDLVRQRRRWAGGLIGLALDPALPRALRLTVGYMTANWTLGVLQHVAVAALLALALGEGASPFLPGVVFVWSFNLAFQAWSYLEGLRINLAVSPRTRRSAARSYAALAAATVLGLVAIAAVEAWAAALGAFDHLARRGASFVVISKGR